MKIGITGHSRGIGASLFKKFVAEGCDVIGFSRSNGYDINNSIGRKSIISKSNGCEIFINNAWAPLSQTLLLNEIIKEWRGTSKLIINISSKIVFDLNDSQYAIDKKTQNDVCRHYIMRDKPRLMNIILGMTDTGLVEDYQCQKIDTAHLADMIFFLVINRDKILTQEIVLDAPGIDYRKIKNSTQTIV